MKSQTNVQSFRVQFDDNIILFDRVRQWSGLSKKKFCGGKSGSNAADDLSELGLVVGGSVALSGCGVVVSVVNAPVEDNHVCWKL